LRFESLEDRRVLSTVTISSLSDVTDGNTSNIAALIANPGTDNKISTREAITAANNTEGEDTINFSTNPADGLNGGTVLLTQGQLSIAQPVTIDATMLPLGITIDAGGNSRIFNITDPTTGSAPPLVTLKGLTLTGGETSGNGGAIYSEARLKIIGCTIEENEAYSGGGIHINVAGGSETTPRNVLTIVDSLIRANTALIAGGGIDIDSGGEGDATADLFTITRTTIHDNQALSTNITLGASGGGIYAELYGAHLSVTASTVSENSTAAASGFIDFAGGGGGLFVELHESASVTVDQSVVHDNQATNGNGGGILAKAFPDETNPFTPRAITISRSTISENTARDRAGGLFLFNREGTEVLVHESRVTGNEVPSNATGQLNGGGIYAVFWNEHVSDPENRKPKLTITGSTIDDNFAPEKGGGVFVNSKNYGEFIATNSTISGNGTTDEESGAGGGIYITPYSVGESVDAWVRNVTVTQNTSADGGGVKAADLNNVRVRMANSIVSQNFDHESDPNNLDGRVMVGDFKHNLLGTGSSILDHATGQAATIPPSNNNVMAQDSPGLGALASNGGPTPTHALLTGSDAIDAGSNTLARHPLTSDDFPYDQRGAGFPRIFDVTGVDNGEDGAVDIGAYEVITGAPKVLDVTVSGSGSTHDDYSFDQHDADGSGKQLKTVPVGGADTSRSRSTNRSMCLNPT
jgi:hypothetical protein